MGIETDLKSLVEAIQSISSSLDKLVEIKTGEVGKLKVKPKAKRVKQNPIPAVIRREITEPAEVAQEKEKEVEEVIVETKVVDKKELLDSLVSQAQELVLLDSNTEGIMADFVLVNFNVRRFSKLTTDQMQETATFITEEIAKVATHE